MRSELAMAAFAALLLVVPRMARADDTPDQAAIRAALTQWTDDFNTRHESVICDLFEKDVIADIRGSPENNFAIVCDRLKRVLGDDTRRYAYSSDIKEILVFGDMAVVRLVWTLTIEGAPAGEDKSVETGMDLFRRQADGSWKIMRWMAYN